jgi:hypothetical protein
MDLALWILPIDIGWLCEKNQSSTSRVRRSFSKKRELTKKANKKASIKAGFVTIFHTYAKSCLLVTSHYP